MRCASFDIGKKNFSFYVEDFECDFGHVSSSHNERYNPDGTVVEDFDKELQIIYANGKKILLENVDITHGCDSKLTLDPETFHNMTDILDKYVEVWDTCSVFIIEKQMMFGKQTNPMAVKLGQHCYSYFALKYGRFKSIVEFPAYHKTQVLGCEKQKNKKTKKGKMSYKAIDKPSRKKWCIEKGKHIINTRKDNDTLEQIKLSKKKDDLCDVICQLQAWKVINFTT